MYADSRLRLTIPARRWTGCSFNCGVPFAWMPLGWWSQIAAVYFICSASSRLQGTTRSHGRAVKHHTQPQSHAQASGLGGRLKATGAKNCLSAKLAMSSLSAAHSPCH